MSLGIKSSAFLGVFTMGSWIHDGFWREKNLREKKQGGPHPDDLCFQLVRAAPKFPLVFMFILKSYLL